MPCRVGKRPCPPFLVPKFDLGMSSQTLCVKFTHNQPSTYLIPATEYEALLERLEDYELGLLAKPTFSNEMNGGFRTSTHPTLAKGF